MCFPLEGISDLRKHLLVIQGRSGKGWSEGVKLAENKEAAASETTEMPYLWDRVLAWQGKKMPFAWHSVVLSILAQ